METLRNPWRRSLAHRFVFAVDTKNTRLKLGIIGCGRASGQLHLPALQRVAAIDVVALADVEPQPLESLGDRFGIGCRHTDYRRLLDEQSIDAVAVCVPPQHHADVSLAVLDAGKHLFVEKPLALSLDDCDRLIGRVRASSCKAMVGLNFRHHRHVLEARKLIEQGTLGPLELLRGSYTAATRQRMQLPKWRERRETGGSVLIEVATHQFDLWRFLLGSEVEWVFACTSRENDGDSSAVVNARMANRVLVSAGLSEQSYDNFEIEIFGQSGRLQLSLYRFDGLQLSPTHSFPGDLKSRVEGIRRTLAELPRGMLAMRHGGEYSMTYEHQWRHFAEAIIGDGKVAVPLEEGRAAVAVALAAIESSATGVPVEVAAATSPAT